MTTYSLRFFSAATLVISLTACAVKPTSSDAVLQEKLSAARITEIIDSADRSPADRTNDVRRKPALMLDFVGVRPGSTVLDLSAGGGYTTELLARAVGPTGRVFGQSAPPVAASTSKTAVVPEGATSAVMPSAATEKPSAPPVRRSSFELLTERAKNPAVKNIVPVVLPFENPVPPQLAASQLDLVTLMFNYHDLGHQGVDRAAMNAAVFKALKRGGSYVIADHAGRPGTGISEAGTLHRIEEDFLRKEVERAGFIFAGEANFLRNPDDPRDRNTPLPPQTKDDFVLKFTKP